MSDLDLPKILRILDANLNRLKEGIRVVEDTLRYAFACCETSKSFSDSTFNPSFDASALALELKQLRHLAALSDYKQILAARDSVNDVLKESTSFVDTESTRPSVETILLSNLKRAQEAARVLEEYLKLPSLEHFGNSANFKEIRYRLYEVERKIVLETRV